jgi:ectoine hydroxylase-related dioxygenase (phytanoyl-CoA dioxygenase family)
MMNNSQILDYGALKAEFDKKGYVIIRNFWAKEYVEQIRAHIEELTHFNDAPNAHYLDKQGLLFSSRLFQKSEFLREALSSPEIIDIMLRLVGKDIWICWDQVVHKKPGGAEFPWHQDNGYYKLRVPHFQLWIALSDNFPENGGLQVLPGSNNKGLVRHKRVGTHEVICEHIEEGDIAKITAEPGDIILFSSLTYHKTGMNVSNVERWAYIVEYMSLHEFQNGVESPYFLVAKDGKPTNQWVTNNPGMRNIRSILSQSDLIAANVVDKIKTKIANVLHLNPS